MIGKVVRWHRDQKGITGLETAIILIAFVVVASVFAYTALSAGLFSTQKSQEAVYSGLQEARSTMELRGTVVAYKGDGVIDSTVGKVEFTVTNAVKNGEKIDLTPPYALADGALVSSGLDNPTQISYNDLNTTVANCAWTLSWVGKHNDDYLLEDNEKAVITVWLHTYNGSVWADGDTPPFLGTDDVSTDHNFTLEVKPPNGAVLTIERTTPASLDTVMDLK
jgi:flagellin FlaB